MTKVVPINLKAKQAYLEANGWKSYHDAFEKDYAINFYKIYHTETSCYCNHNDGVQLCVRLYSLESMYSNQPHASNYCGWDISVKAEDVSDCWVDFEFYSLDINKLENLVEKLAQKLLIAWESVANLKIDD